MKNRSKIYIQARTAEPRPKNVQSATAYTTAVVRIDRSCSAAAAAATAAAAAVAATGVAATDAAADACSSLFRDLRYFIGTNSSECCKTLRVST